MRPGKPPAWSSRARSLSKNRPDEPGRRYYFPSQVVWGQGLGRSRYVGLRKTQVQNVLRAGAINLVGLDANLAGKQAAKRRVSGFGALGPAVALSGYGIRQQYLRSG